MSLDINGKILFENRSEPRFTFQMYNNPTRRNLKKEMINYKVKLDANRTHNNFNRNQSKLFEPTIRILPSKVISKSNCFPPEITPSMSKIGQNGFLPSISIYIIPFLFTTFTLFNI